MSTLKTPKDSSVAALKDLRVKIHDMSMDDLAWFLKSEKFYYGYVLSRLPKIADTDTKTMAVGIHKGKYTFFYHPEWYKYLPRNQAAAVVAHECMHVLLGHISRYHKLLRNNPDEEVRENITKVSNIAADFAVNTLLAKEALLPADALRCEDYGFESSLTYEDYVFLLIKDGTQDSSGKFKLSNPQLEELAENAMNSHLWSADLKDKESQMSENQINKIKSIKQVQEGLSASLDSAMKQTVDEAKSILSEMQIADLQKQELDLYTKVKEIVNSSSTRGTVPGSLVEHFDNIIKLNSKHWSNILFREVKKTFKSTPYFGHNELNYNAVCLGSQISLFGAPKEDLLFNVIWAIDTSYSMSSEDIQDVFNVLIAVLKGPHKSTLRIIEFDTQIHRQYVVDKHNKIDLKVHGRGGTDFNAVFKYVKENKKALKPDLLIVSSDGYATRPEEENMLPNNVLPVIWLLTKKGTSKYLDEKDKTIFM